MPFPVVVVDQAMHAWINDPCEKCRDAAHRALNASVFHGRVTGETYTFTMMNPDQEIVWSVDVAKGYIRDGLVPVRTLDSDRLGEWLSRYVDMTPEHLDHIPSERADEPGILLVVSNTPPDTGVEEQFPILIDGTHRAYRKLRDGEPFRAYVLSEDQQMDCRIAHTYADGTPVEPYFEPGFAPPPESCGLIDA